MNPNFYSIQNDIFDISDEYFLSDDDSVKDENRNHTDVESLINYLEYVRIQDEEGISNHSFSDNSRTNFINTSVFKHRRRADRLILTEDEKALLLMQPSNFDEIGEISLEFLTSDASFASAKSTFINDSIQENNEATKNQFNPFANFQSTSNESSSLSINVSEKSHRETDDEGCDVNPDNSDESGMSSNSKQIIEMGSGYLGDSENGEFLNDIVFSQPIVNSKEDFHKKLFTNETDSKSLLSPKIDSNQATKSLKPVSNNEATSNSVQTAIPSRNSSRHSIRITIAPPAGRISSRPPVRSNNIPANLQIYWYPKICATLCLWSEADNAISLSPKLILKAELLAACLLHSMLHCAITLVDKVPLINSHSKYFQAWLVRAKLAFPELNFLYRTIPTDNNYQWHYKCERCSKVYKRHGNTINTVTKRCICGGSLMAYRNAGQIVCRFFHGHDSSEKSKVYCRFAATN